MRFDRAWAAGLPLLFLAGPLAAQDALSGVGPATQVRKIEFRFVGEHTLGEKDLRPPIALTANSRIRARSPGLARTTTSARFAAVSTSTSASAAPNG